MGDLKKYLEINRSNRVFILLILYFNNNENL
jgi:hypothetical protein